MFWKRVERKRFRFKSLDGRTAQEHFLRLPSGGGQRKLRAAVAEDGEAELYVVRPEPFTEKTATATSLLSPSFEAHFFKLTLRLTLKLTLKYINS